MPRLQTHVDFFYPELQWDIMRYDPSLVTLDEALFDLSSPSITPPNLQHHVVIDTTPLSMSTPLLHDVVEMSPSPSFEEGILYTSTNGYLIDTFGDLSSNLVSSYLIDRHPSPFEHPYIG